MLRMEEKYVCGHYSTRPQSKTNFYMKKNQKKIGKNQKKKSWKSKKIKKLWWEKNNFILNSNCAPSAQMIAPHFLQVPICFPTVRPLRNCDKIPPTFGPQKGKQISFEFFFFSELLSRHSALWHFCGNVVIKLLKWRCKIFLDFQLEKNYFGQFYCFFKIDPNRKIIDSNRNILRFELHFVTIQIFTKLYV